MGEHVADMEIGLHGEGATHHLARVRLHWGDEGIDETHTMGDAVFSSLLTDACNGYQTGFEDSVKTWIDNNASAAAKAKKAQFAAAGWKAFP